MSEYRASEFRITLNALDLMYDAEEHDIELNEEDAELAIGILLNLEGLQKPIYDALYEAAYAAVEYARECNKEPVETP